MLLKLWIGRKEIMLVTEYFFVWFGGRGRYETVCVKEESSDQSETKVFHC